MDNPPTSNNPSWDSEGFDNEALDLEMARLPSSMFDADNILEGDDDEF